MVKEIKVIDSDGIEIKPDNNLVTIPIKGEIKFVSADTARDLMRIIQGQINILEAENVISKTGDGKHKKHTTRKTGSDVGGSG